MQEISIYEMRDAVAMHDTTIGIIDVRTPEEFSEGHIESALNIPLDTIENYLDTLKQYSKVYIYCRSGGRSQQGCFNVSMLGIKNAYTMRGGILEWQKQGNVLVK